MTTLTILNGDWEILFDDETVGANAVAGLKTVRRASGASETVYETNELYSAIAAIADAFTAMGFENPILPVTPNAYTIENKYFIPRSSIEYLKEGALTCNWSLVAPGGGGTEGGGVIAKEYSGGTNFVSGDIGRQVTESASGDTGTLLDFEVLPDGRTIAWIRPDDPTPTTGDIFDGTTGTLSVTGDGGTGSVNVTIAAADPGTVNFPAIQAIGSVPTATEVYAVQDRQKLTDSLGNFQWWATDPTANLGIISILVRINDPTQSNFPLIAQGDIEVFARRYTSLYDNFRLNIAGGGFSALPLASAPDINNTTGYTTVLGTAGSGTWNVGNLAYVGVDFASATKKAVITAVSGTTVAPILELYYVGNLNPFIGGSIDTIQEYDPIAQADGDASCDVDVLSDTSGGPLNTSDGGGNITFTLGNTAFDYDGDGTSETYSITVDVDTKLQAIVYERLKYVARRGGNAADLFGASFNIPGETYRGLEGVFEVDTYVAGWGEGDDIDIAAKSNFSARSLSNHNTTPPYVTLTDIQTSLQAVEDNDVLRDESSDTVTVNGAGALGIETFTSPKSSPLGTSTGTQIFGARGVLFTNLNSADIRNYILTDDFGNLRPPPNLQSIIVNNTAAGDRVLASRDTGTSGIIDKDRFGGLVAPLGSYNGIGDQIIRVAGNIDSEVADSGFVRVVDTSKQEEHHYVYDSLTDNGGSNDEFNLRVIPTGTATAGTNSTTLVDSGATFQTNNVEPGMLIYNTTTAGEYYEVVSVDSETQLTIISAFNSPNTLKSTDGYAINRIINDYEVNDDVFDLILDLEADGSSEFNTIIKTPAADFGIVVNVRQGGVILPFTQNATVGDGGAVITVVRAPDNIFTP